MQGPGWRRDWVPHPKRPVMTAQKEKELAVKLTIAGLFETFCKDITSASLHILFPSARQVSVVHLFEHEALHCFHVIFYQSWGECISQVLYFKRHVFVFSSKKPRLAKVQKADMNMMHHRDTQAVCIEPPIVPSQGFETTGPYFVTHLFSISSTWTSTVVEVELRMDAGPVPHLQDTFCPMCISLNCAYVYSISMLYMLQTHLQVILAVAMQDMIIPRAACQDWKLCIGIHPDSRFDFNPSQYSSADMCTCVL